jgi:translation initiation factor IF-3
MNNQTQSNFKHRNFPKKVWVDYKINERIYAKKIRLVQEGEEPVICSTEDALTKAKEIGFDLVEISPNSDPPVCKIIDLQKFLYDKKKKEKENKKSKSTTSLKEVKISPNIGEHDYSFKVKQAGEFLQKGNKVKVNMLFKGRTIVYKEQGEMLMLRFSQEPEVNNFSKVEQLPKMEGKFLNMILVPKKK